MFVLGEDVVGSGVEVLSGGTSTDFFARGQQMFGLFLFAR